MTAEEEALLASDPRDLTAEQREQRRRLKQREYQRRYRDKYPAKTKEIRLNRIARDPNYEREKYLRAVAARESDPARLDAYRDMKRRHQREYALKYPDRVKATLKKYADAKRRSSSSCLVAIGEALNAALGKNTLYAAALAAVPRTLPHHVREDVVSDLVLAVLEEEITEADLPRVAKSYISKHYRDSGFHTTRSLDAPIPGRDGLTYVDTISNEHAGAFL